MKGIKRAVSLHNSGVTTVYNSLVGMSGLKEIALACRKLGANSIMVTLCSPTIDSNGEASIGYSINPYDLAKDIVEMTDYLDGLYDDRVQIDMQMPLCLLPTDFVKRNLVKNKILTLCQVFDRSGLNFTPEGNIAICNELTIDMIAKKGTDFTDSKSLLHYLNSQKLRNFYGEILRYPAECCSSCGWRFDCRGGCLMNWLVFDPDMCHAIKV